jgi:hypothetical protein
MTAKIIKRLLKPVFRNGFGVALILGLPFSVLLGAAALASMFKFHWPPPSSWIVAGVFALSVEGVYYNWDKLWYSDKEYKGYRHLPLFIVGLVVLYLLLSTI